MGKKTSRTPIKQSQLAMKLPLKKISFVFKVILLFFSLPIFLSSCKPSPSTTRPLRIAFSYMPLALDPRTTTDPLTVTFHSLLYEGLTHLNPDGSIQLTLAEKIDISFDQKTYFFYLKRAFWSNGDPLTARDFVRSWKQILDPRFPSRAAHLFYPIQSAQAAKKGQCSLEEVGIEAPSERLLIVKLSKPTPYFLHLTSCPAFFPVWSSPKREDKQMVVNGPFLLDNWKENHSITVKKNPLFVDAKNVRLENIHIAIIKDSMTAFELFQKKELDWIGGMISPLHTQIASNPSSPLPILVKPVAGTAFCLFEVNTPPFHNRKIRQAFALSINREYLAKYVSQLGDVAASSLFPPVFQQPLPSLSQSASPSSLLREGLEELGWTKEDLPLLTYHYFQSEMQEKIALAIQNEWRETLGVDVQLAGHPLPTYFSFLRNRKFQFAQTAWIAHYLDPMSFLERLSANWSDPNYLLCNSPLFHHLLEESRETTGQKRRNLLSEAEKIVLEECFLFPLYHFGLTYLESPNLQGVTISPLGIVHFRAAAIQ